MHVLDSDLALQLHKKLSEVGNKFKPSSKTIFTDQPKATLPFVDHLLFIFCICHAFLSFYCSLVVTCWERIDLLARLYVKSSCVFVTFPCGVLGQVWCLIVSISDLCLLTYLVTSWVCACT